MSNALRRFLHLLLAVVLTTQALRLQRVNNGAGILPVRKGEAVISSDKWIVFKVLNISLLCRDLEFNVNRYANLNNHVLSYFKGKLDVGIANIKTQTDYIKDTTIGKLRQISPSKRIKRGILNPLGSLIKIFTGNLDNDDAIRYDNLISEAKLRTENVAKKLSLVTEMVQSFVNIANSTQNNFIQLDKAIWELRKQINITKSVQIREQIISVYNLFFHNFQTLFIRLDELETTIAFSKLRTLHQSILDSDELLQILKKIEENNKLVYPVNEANLVKIEQTIELKSYFKENQITFILEIPLIKKDIYTYYKILPIPTTNESNQTTLIIPKFPYLIMKGLKTQSLSQPCKKIDEQYYLCNENEMSAFIEDTCVIDLMKRTPNATSCRPTYVKLENIKLTPIQLNRWILYSKDNSVLTQVCKDEVTHHNIQGTYILTMNENCIIEIEKYKLKKRTLQFEKIKYSDLPLLSLPEILPLQPEKESYPINLEEIDLSDIRLMSYLLKKSESEVICKVNESVINVKSISVGTVIIYVILILIIIIVLLYLYRYKKDIRNHHSEKSPNEDFELKEGGVIHSHGLVSIQT
ncbi:hypothetical protein JYU34_018001 [Plutella xylostella]|uniref:Envelope protein n=1 Tax=Plutella xylostella TaxID=51655 RepID=A0ABQ7Q0Y1_PLUXY|nr:hypothetical protein JYU34_018001 [Plutella xylostella]